MANWPGGEMPMYVIDDNPFTKYLHFDGESETSGFQITPAVGATVVKGLSFVDRQ